MSVRNRSYTFYTVILLLFLIPLVDYKYYLGPIPLSAEVLLIPLLLVVAFAEHKKGLISLNEFNVIPILIAFSAFLLVSVISLINAVNVLSGLMEIARYLSYVLMWVVVVKVHFERKEYIYFLWTFVASTALVVIFGSMQYIFEFGLNTAGLYALNDAVGRVESTMVNPNYYAAFINFVLPGSMILAVMYTKQKPVQLALFLITSVLIANMVLTYTRVAWLIMFGAILLVILLAGKEYLKRMVKIHMIVIVALLALFVYNMPDFQSRTVSAIYVAENMVFGSDFFSQEEEPENDLGLVEEAEEEEKRERDEMSERAMVSRTTLWKTGWVMFRDNPVLGVGAGNYLDRYSDYVAMYPELYLGHDRYSVHNSYLKVMAETGVIGIVAFMSVYLLYYYYLVRFYFQQEPAGKLVAVALFVGSITFMLQNTSNNLIFIPQINIIFWIVSGLVFNYLYIYRNK